MYDLPMFDRPTLGPLARLLVLRALLPLLLIIEGFAFTKHLRAEQASEHVPSPLCLGFNPENGRWGAQTPSLSEPEARCPANQAYFAATPMVASEEFPITGYCCPLAPGTLSDESVWVKTNCPAGFVMTGTRLKSAASDQFLCTKVNSARFRLSSKSSGVRVDFSEDVFLGFRDRLLQHEQPMLARAAISPRYRYGFGRVSYTAWAPTFCLGLPLGGVLTGVSGMSCSQFFFQELLEISSENKQQGRGERECVAIDNPFAASGRCLEMP